MFFKYRENVNILVKYLITSHSANNVGTSIVNHKIT